MGTKPLPLLPVAERTSLAAWGSLAPAAPDDCSKMPDGDAKGAGVWPSLLQGLCKAAQASMGLLATVDWSCRGVILHGLVNAPAHDNQWRTIQPTTLDPFIPGLSASVDLGSIWTTTDGSIEGTDGSTAFLTRWLRRHGITHVIYGVVAVQALRTTYLALGRQPETIAFSDDDIGKLRSILPGVQAIFVTERRIEGLQSERRTLLSLLDQMPTGIALLNRRYETIFVNDYMKQALAGREDVQTLLAQLCDPRRHEHGKASDAHAMLPPNAAIEQCWVHAVPQASGRRSLSIIAQRLRREATTGADDDAAFILFLSDPSRRVELDQDGLCHLHGLTRAEGRLAALLAGGGHIEDAARLLGISIHTARTHLKRIFSKTDTSSQSDLVRLALSAPTPIRTA